MNRHCISGGLLSSQLCKHCPHKSPQPTHLSLTQHCHNEKNELNESSFPNIQVPEMSHLSYSSFPLLPETHHSAQGCLHLLFPKSGEGRGQSIIWKKTWQHPVETWFLVHHRQKPATCRAVMSGMCTEHARSNVICPELPVLPAIPILWLFLHHVCPAAELGSEAWCISPPWGAMLSGALPL